MSSPELRIIFERAAALVEARLATEPGVSTVLADLAKRVPEIGEDPRSNRQLFFEPRIDSQQLGIPRLTAEKVAILLHRFGVFHIWARISCPSIGDNEPGTIVESDSANDVRKSLSRSCDHCGEMHEGAEADYQSVYAFVSSTSKDPVDFDFTSLELGGVEQALDENKEDDVGRLSILADEVVSTKQVEVLLLEALATNTGTKELPAPREVYVNAWKGPLLLLSLYVFGIVPISKLAGPMIALCTSALFLLVGWMTLRSTVQARLAPSIIQRTAMYLGMPLGIGCIASGATGFHFAGAAGQETPWWTRWEFGETSFGLAGIGLLLIAMVLGFVLIYDGKIGWLR